MEPSCIHCNYELGDFYICTDLGIFCNTCFKDRLWDHIELRAVQKYSLRDNIDCCSTGNIFADGRPYCIVCLMEAIQKGTIFFSIKLEARR